MQGPIRGTILAFERKQQTVKETMQWIQAVDRQAMVLSSVTPFSACVHSIFFDVEHIVL